MAWVPVTDWNTVEHNTRARDADGNEGTLYGFHTYTQLGTTGRPHWDGHPITDEYLTQHTVAITVAPHQVLIDGHDTHTIN